VTPTGNERSVNLLGDNLALLRISAWMTQPELAHLFTVTGSPTRHSQISEWESGKVKPSSKRLEAYQRLFQIPHLDFLWAQHPDTVMLEHGLGLERMRELLDGHELPPIHAVHLLELFLRRKRMSERLEKLFDDRASETTMALERLGLWPTLAGATEDT